MNTPFNNNIGNTFGGMQPPKVNPLDYPSDKCSACGNEVFIPGVIIKNVPGMLLGQGNETVPFPIKVFVCSKCGELSNADKDILKKEQELKNQSTATTDLII